jgi:hypothetical protein
MKHFLTISIILVLAISSLHAQDSFKKYPIGDSGCSVYFFNEPGPSDMSYSQDSSQVYTIESLDPEGINCSVILVSLSTEFEGDDIVDLTEAYLDYLKDQLKVTESVGYSTVETLSTHPTAKCIRDYWQDEDSEMSVMAHNDGRYIAVMLAWSDKEGYDITPQCEAFFKGFRFPGD